ncbi:MAG: hypothetical protein ACKOJI_08980, partial [Phycisphaerales bacterium]
RPRRDLPWRGQEGPIGAKQRDRPDAHEHCGPADNRRQHRRARRDRGGERCPSRRTEPFDGRARPPRKQRPVVDGQAEQRIVARRGDGSGSLLLVLDARMADAAAADRPELYDLDTLRARFAPEQVRTVE